MAVLAAIGAFFKRIWTWIKDTAWVQPLLIVGVIFAVMFSIPSIVDGIESLADDLNSDEAYYTRFQQSLVDGEDSEADRLTRWIMEEQENPTGNYDQYGEKFFLMYVSQSCASCAEARTGFEYLENNFNTMFVANDGLPFRMYTIFTDEVTDETTSNETAFVKYMNRNPYFFESAASDAYNSEYYINGFINDSDLQAMESADPENFLTPTILLVDFTETSPVQGVSEVFFGVTGDDNYSKAEFLIDCWNHDGDFGQD